MLFIIFKLDKGERAPMSGSYLHPLLLGHFVFLQSVFFWHSYNVVLSLTVFQTCLAAVYRYTWRL